MKLYWLLLPILLLLITGCSKPPDSYHGIVVHETGEIINTPTDVHWVKSFPGPVFWGDIQTSKDLAEDEWNWEAVDQLVNQATNQNTQLIVTIWPYANWDQQICHSDFPTITSIINQSARQPYSLCSKEDYMIFLTELIQRYKDNPVYWEIMNIPEWQTEPTASFIGSNYDYYEILKLSYETIKDTDNQAVVMHGAMMKPDNATISFWSPLLEQDFKDYTDVLNVRVPKEEQETTLEAYNSWFETYELDMPIWVTQTPVEFESDLATKVFYNIEE